LLVVVVGRGRMPGMIPPVAVAVVVIVVATTCCGVAVVRVMVRMTIRTQTRFPDPGQTQSYV